MSSATHKLYVSTFKTPAATKVFPLEVTLQELATVILEASAKTKDRLPWLKLAIFGNVATEKGSLRTDENLMQITGVELDYDGEEISFADGVAKLREIGLTCLVYTSPSHTPSKPRWRILCPTSQPLEPSIRAALVARLNGRLDAILANHRESFTLSQSYYYGRAEDNPDPNHAVQVLDGDFIDLREDLLAFEAAGRIAEEENLDERQAYFEGVADEDEDEDEDEGRHFKGRFHHVLASMGDGKDKNGKDLRGFNHPLIEATSIYAGAFETYPFDKEKLKAILRIAIQVAPKRPSRAASEIAEYMSDRTLDKYIKSAIRKHHHTNAVTVMGFVADLASNTFIYDRTGESWSATAVDQRLHPVPMVEKNGMLLYRKNGKIKSVRASSWLRKHRKAEQRTWYPGQEKIIKGMFVSQDGQIFKTVGHDCYNFYTPPVPCKGDAANAMQWVELVQRVYPDESNMILDWLAHRFQKPGEKINFALLLGGASGIGKDTIITPAGQGLGPHNFNVISPRVVIESQFTGYRRSVLLVVNEIHDVGESNRYRFYETMKQLCAAPPPTLEVNLKQRQEFWIINVVGVVMTTNHREAIYLPEDDRRTYVCWSNLQRTDFPDGYFDKLWGWINNGGMQDIWAYLRQRDISKFNFKKPPPRTIAHDNIVQASSNPETEEIGEIVDRHGLDAITLQVVATLANAELAEWLADRKNATRIRHRFQDIGFEVCLNPDSTRGLWTIHNEGTRVYVRNSVGSTLFAGERERLRQAVAKRLVEDLNANRGPSSGATIHPFSRV